MATPQRELPISAAPLRQVQLGTFDAMLERNDSGVIHLRTAQVLPPSRSSG